MQSPEGGRVSPKELGLMGRGPPGPGRWDSLCLRLNTSPQAPYLRNTSSGHSEVASLSSVSLPQGQKGQSGFTPSCFSGSLGV